MTSNLSLQESTNSSKGAVSIEPAPTPPVTHGHKGRAGTPPRSNSKSLSRAASAAARDVVNTVPAANPNMASNVIQQAMRGQSSSTWDWDFASRDYAGKIGESLLQALLVALLHPAIPGLPLC